MSITHQIVDNPALPVAASTGLLNQLSGLIGQAQGMLTANASLSGIQGIGSQITALTTAIAAAGGATGSATDTSGIASVVNSLGSQLSSVSSMAGVSNILSSLTTQLGNLTNIVSPAGMAQAIHSHVMDALSGILHSAFNGKHTVQLGSGGISLQSLAKIANTAPILPHNGLTTVSDALQVTLGITGQSFGMLSDERLKDNIKDHPPVLDRVMSLRLKTFNVKTVDWETGEVHPSDGRASLGLIAQELQKVFPELVTDGRYLSLEEGKVAMVLLSAFQEFVAETRRALAELKK